MKVKVALSSLELKGATFKIVMADCTKNMCDHKTGIVCRTIGEVICTSDDVTSCHSSAGSLQQMSEEDFCHESFDFYSQLHKKFWLTLRQFRHFSEERWNFVTCFITLK